jgi:predicted metal-binding protein
MKQQDFLNKLVKLSYIKTFINDKSQDIDPKLLLHADIHLNRSFFILLLFKCFKCIAIASDIEESIFEFTLLYVTNLNLPQQFLKSVYVHKFLDLYSLLELSDEKLECTAAPQTYLRNAIIHSTFPLRTIAFLSPQQLCPSNWDCLIRKNNIRKMKAEYIETTDAYRCGRCGERKCHVTPRQTRSADEPMTLYISCLICHYQFKK